jgi:hypothetical protein
MTYKRSYPRRGQSLPYRQDRFPALQTNDLQLPVLHIPYNLTLPERSGVRSVLPEGNVIFSVHAGCVSSGWIDLPCTLQTVCQRNALTLAPRRVGPLHT